MKKVILLGVIALSLFAAGCGTKSKAEYTITFSGAFALYPMVVKWSEEYKKIHPEVDFDITAGGAGKGMADVLAGMVNVAMVSRDVSAEEIAKGAWFVPVAHDAVLGTMNANNPMAATIQANGITRDQFKAIFVDQTITTWGALYGTAGAETIDVYTRADACGAAETWAKFLGGKQEDLKGVGVNADPGLAEAVRSDVLGIGFNNVNYAYNAETRLPVDGILPIPIDINGNGKIDESESFYGSLETVVAAIADGRYPSPPARDLFLVCLGSPTNTYVVEFMKWVLTEGQKMEIENGYVPLPEAVCAEALNKIQ